MHPRHDRRARRMHALLAYSDLIGACPASSDPSRARIFVTQMAGRQHWDLLGAFKQQMPMREFSDSRSKPPVTLRLDRPRPRARLSVACLRSGARSEFDILTSRFRLDSSSVTRTSSAAAKNSARAFPGYRRRCPGTL
jgi:hypothetical protein